ncbi:MAG: DoxX family membrane protein [bacterium]|jgi:uncharacterized membrane protein YphA (DoxX/SURF4 family)
MNRRFLDNDYLTLIVRLIVGGIFIYASLDKVTNPAQFARIVYNYHLLPAALINIFALMLPWVELLCGIFLVAGYKQEGSVLILNLLVLAFIVALTVNLFRGVNIECGCFTVSSKAKSNIIDLLLRDIGLLALTLYLFFSRSRRFSLSPSDKRIRVS